MIDKGYCWLIFGLLVWMSVMNGWWWMIMLLGWTMLFTVVPSILNQLFGETRNEWRSQE